MLFALLMYLSIIAGCPTGTNAAFSVLSPPDRYLFQRKALLHQWPAATHPLCLPLRPGYLLGPQSVPEETATPEGDESIVYMTHRHQPGEGVAAVYDALGGFGGA